MINTTEHQLIVLVAEIVTKNDEHLQDLLENLIIKKHAQIFNNLTDDNKKIATTNDLLREATKAIEIALEVELNSLIAS